MKSVSRVMIAYGAFLMAMGLLGYLSNPEKAKTALMSGGLFGSLSIGIGLLARRGWQKAPAAALGLAGLLSVVFIWRSSVGWLAVFSGQAEKLPAAVIITVMLVGSGAVIGLLIFGLRTVRSGDTMRGN